MEACVVAVVLLLSAVDWKRDRGNRMDDRDRIAVGVSLDLAGGGVVAFTPAGAGVFASRNSVFDVIGLDGQGYQGFQKGHLIEMAVE